MTFHINRHKLHEYVRIELEKLKEAQKEACLVKISDPRLDQAGNGVSAKTHSTWSE